MRANESRWQAADPSRWFAGGVSAGGRHNRALGGPLLVRRCSGAWVEAEDGRTYLDFHNAAGAAFFGFNHPRLRAAVERAMRAGFFLNFDTGAHLELAQRICECVPCAERVRFCNSGTESTMAAVRVARHYTGRDKILKFDGHFHGMHELTWYNHSAVAPKGNDGSIMTMPDSSGFPAGLSHYVRVVDYNDEWAFDDALASLSGELAAVIVEPISYNCGCMPSKNGFLEHVRARCSEEGIVLIFDEVLSGFRMCVGGAQQYYGVTPDLVTLAKALGGGFPVAALAGRSEIMECLNPSGPVVMSGTYTGALIPVSAAVECLRMMSEPEFYSVLNSKAEAFYAEINTMFDRHGLPGHLRGIGARFALYFGVENPEDDYVFRSTSAAFSPELHSRFVDLALQKGLYFLDTGFPHAPTHYGITAAHSEAELEWALGKLEHVFREL